MGLLSLICPKTGHLGKLRGNLSQEYCAVVRFRITRPCPYMLQARRHWLSDRIVIRRRSGSLLEIRQKIADIFQVVALHHGAPVATRKHSQSAAFRTDKQDDNSVKRRRPIDFLHPVLQGAKMSHRELMRVELPLACFHRVDIANR